MELNHHPEKSTARNVKNILYSFSFVAKSIFSTHREIFFAYANVSS